MPIYEFRCLSCNECFEILVLKKDETVESRCPKCGAEGFERVLSKTCYAMGASESKGAGASAQTRTCSGGPAPPGIFPVRPVDPNPIALFRLRR